MVNKITPEFDNPLNNIINGQIDTTLPIYNKMNFTPNTLTTISLLFGLSAVYAVYTDYYKIGAILFFFASYYDSVDGKYARKYNQETTFGDAYDHVADYTKFGLMFYVLYFKLKLKSLKIKIILLSTLVILLILGLLQFGCQEYLYESDNSPTLEWTKKFVIESKCNEQVKYTKYFSITTFICYLCIIIFFWEYI
jgi:phosphatidylglycerophosphate synthase